MTATKEQRRQHVTAMRANFGIEGIRPEAEDLVWQERYIEGTASLDDLLNHAHSFAREHRKREEAINFGRASMGLEGFKPSGAAEAQGRRFIRGEITMAEFVKLTPEEE